jgi:hypothetical protein
VKVFIAYRENSDYARDVIDYLRDFERRTSRTIEEINPDTRDGAERCLLYDIVEYPCIVATDDDGRLQNLWRGLPLPLIDEVSYYVQ